MPGNLGVIGAAISHEPNGDVLMASAAAWLKSSAYDEFGIWENLGMDGPYLDARLGSAGPCYASGQFLYCGGAVNNRATVPGSGLNAAGELVIEVMVRFNRMSGSPTIVGRYSSTQSKAWSLDALMGYGLYFTYSTDGNNWFDVKVGNIDAAPGQIWGYRLTINGTDVHCEHSPNGGVSWTHLQYATLNGPIYADATADLAIGTYSAEDGATGNLNGIVHYLKITDDGVALLDIDFSDVPRRVSSFVDNTGKTVTIHSTGAADTNDPTFIADYDGDGPYFAFGPDDYMVLLSNFDLGEEESCTILSCLRPGEPYSQISLTTQAGYAGNGLCLSGSEGGYSTFTQVNDGSDQVYREGAHDRVVDAKTVYGLILDRDAGTLGALFSDDATGTSLNTADASAIGAVDHGTFPTIGYSVGGPDRYLNGHFKALAIWRRVLDEDEMTLAIETMKAA